MFLLGNLELKQVVVICAVSIESYPFGTNKCAGSVLSLDYRIENGCR